MRVGDRVFLSGAYDHPGWLQGGPGYAGTLERFIPGHNEGTFSAGVRLQAALTLEGVTRLSVPLDLRYVGATWEADEVIGSVELCEFVPEALPVPERRRGTWVQTHATIRRDDRARG